MANNYVSPALRVYQMVDDTVTTTGGHLSTCVVGANYELYRYGYEELPAYSYSVGQKISFTGLESTEAGISYSLDTDADNISLYGVGMEAQILGSVKKGSTYTGGYSVTVGYDTGTVTPGDDPFVLDTDINLAIAAGYSGTLDERLNGFPVELGDQVYATYSGAVYVGTVTELLGKKVAKSLTAGAQSVTAYSYGTKVYSGLTNSYSAVDNYIRVSFSGDYDSLYDTMFIARAVDVQYTGTDTARKMSSATINVEDTTGRTATQQVTFTSTEITAGTSKELSGGYSGLSLSIKATSSMLYYSGVGTGDAFGFVYKAPSRSETELGSVRIDTPIGDAAAMALTSYTAGLTVSKPINAVLTQFTSDYSSTTPSVTLKANTIDLTGRPNVPFNEGFGDVYLSYRVQVIPDTSEDVFAVADTEDIQNYFGTISPDNDLAYGCYCAIKGSAGRTIYAIRTRGTDSEAFTDAIEKTEADSSVYNFCALTNDVDVMDAVYTYNMTQSTAEKKHWRINFFGPRAVKAYALTSTTSKGLPIYASVTKTSSGKSFVILDSTTDFDFTSIPLNSTTTSLYPGDMVQLIDGNKYVINAVTRTSLELVSGPTTTFYNTSLTLWKADTAKNAAEYVESVADNFSNRRAVVTWSDNATNDDGVVDNKYLAATVAGMSSSFLPQAPMTRAELETVASAPRMYTRYTQSDLDNIAVHGVMIITQDTKGGPCYIRHQLTTEMDKGILYQELSITRNLDNISYAMVDALETYVGRSNVTDSAIDALAAKVLTILTGFTSNSTDDKIGPSLGKFSDLNIYQDPTFLTRVIIKVKLYLPVPMNNIDVYEMAYAYDTVTGYTQVEAVEI